MSQSSYSTSRLTSAWRGGLALIFSLFGMIVNLIILLVAGITLHSTSLLVKNAGTWQVPIPELQKLYWQSGLIAAIIIIAIVGGHQLKPSHKNLASLTGEVLVIILLWLYAAPFLTWWLPKALPNHLDQVQSTADLILKCGLLLFALQTIACSKQP